MTSWLYLISFVWFLIGCSCIYAAIKWGGGKLNNVIDKLVLIGILFVHFGITYIIFFHIAVGFCIATISGLIVSIVAVVSGTKEDKNNDRWSNYVALFFIFTIGFPVIVPLFLATIYFNLDGYGKNK
jgi:hypothetical protein